MPKIAPPSFYKNQQVKQQLEHFYKNTMCPPNSEWKMARHTVKFNDVFKTNKENCIVSIKKDAHAKDLKGIYLFLQERIRNTLGFGQRNSSLDLNKAMEVVENIKKLKLAKIAKFKKVVK